jgi:hypothetical protein
MELLQPLAKWVSSLKNVGIMHHVQKSYEDSSVKLMGASACMCSWDLTLVGKPCYIMVWRTDIPAHGDTETPFSKIGVSYFKRAICALAFTCDAK